MARVVVASAIILCCHFAVSAELGIRCPFPSYPKNGRVYYSSLDYGAELQYECEKGFMMQNYEPNICTEGGMWSSNVPECIEIICNMPEEPEHGSVLLYEEPPKAGALAFYTCNDGTTLFGTSTLKCQDSGFWTPAPPKCLRSCYVPAIHDGEIGRYKKNRLRQEFILLKTGESVKHLEIVILRCTTEGNKTTGLSRNVVCNDGVWSEPLHCRSSICETDPPQLNNGKPKKFARVNSSHVDYECNEGYELEGQSTVYCAFGIWVGMTPTCKSYDCIIPHLHHGHLMETKIGDHWSWKKFKYEKSTIFVEIPAGTTLSHGSSVTLLCDSHYFCQGTSLRNQSITCFKGRLRPDPICLRHTPICRLEEKKSSHLIVSPLKAFYRVGEFIVLSCPIGYKLTDDAEKIMCLGSSWSHTLPDCIEIG